MDEGDESVAFSWVLSQLGFFCGSPVFFLLFRGFLDFVIGFFLAFQGIFRLCNRFFMQFFVIIKVTEKQEKKGKGHARIFVGFDLDQVSEDEV